MYIEQYLTSEFTKFLGLSKTDAVMKPREWARKITEHLMEGESND